MLQDTKCAIFSAKVAELKTQEKNIFKCLRAAITSVYAPDDFLVQGDMRVLDDGELIVKLREEETNENNFWVADKPIIGKATYKGKDIEMPEDISRVLYNFANGKVPRQRTRKKQKKSTEMISAILG